MAASIKHIKSFKNDDFTMLQKLATYVFGDLEITKYNPNHVYSKHDPIIYQDPVTGNIKILKSKENNVTGTFDITKWNEASIGDFIDSQNTVIVSEAQPDDPNNKVWWEIRNTKNGTIGGGASDQAILVFDANGVITQDDEPTSNNVQVWFDIEP